MQVRGFDIFIPHIMICLIETYQRVQCVTISVDYKYCDITNF